MAHRRNCVYARAGTREPLVLDQPASGEPFDHGIFRIVEEPAQAAWPEDDPNRFHADRILWERPVKAARTELRVLS